MNRMSMKELEKLEGELRKKDFEEYSHLEWKLIAVYKEMLRQMKPDDASRPYIIENVVKHLIRYGVQMKSERDPDLHTAKVAMQGVLKYDRSNPIASYRLGFIAYRNKEYLPAQVHFQNALINHERLEGHKYRLTEQQVKNAYLYLTNSSLYVANTTYEEMNEKFSDLPEQLSSYEFPDLYERLNVNEHYLESRAFVKEIKEGISYCSKEECEKITDNVPENTVVLYFAGRETILYFNDEDIVLSKQNGFILRYLLKNSTEQRPATRVGGLATYFEKGKAEDVPRNTFIQAIRRLVSKMDEIGIPPVIRAVERTDAVRPAYYFDHSLPFIILSRVDENWD